MLSSDPDSLLWLDENHLSAVDRSLRNVLATKLALQTFAQILDGLPLAEEASQSSDRINRHHPITSHVTLCNGVMEKALQIRRDFDLAALKFDPNLLQAYQASPRESRAFRLRLIEVTAVALHQIAVFLFQQHVPLHDPATTDGQDVESITTWERPPDMWARITPYPTLFTQPHFTAVEQYPNGVADMVGYWAEDRILGGVVLFDRSQSWHDNEPNAYFQPGRVDVTFRICQLLDAQQQKLVNFLLADLEQSRHICPLPILVSRENRVRMDPGDAIPCHQVYRDPWERKVQYRMPGDRGPCVISSLDYPEEDVDAELKRMKALIEKK